MPKIRITGRKLPAAQDGKEVEGPFFLGPDGKPQIKTLSDITLRTYPQNGKYYVPSFGYLTPEEIQQVKYRVEMSRGYDPEISWREQVGLVFENSLLDRISRGANMTFSSDMYGIKPVQWLRNIVFAPSAGAVSLARTLSGEDMATSPEPMAKAAPWDVTGLGMIPHAAKSAEEFMQNPGVLTGLSTVANTFASLPIIGAVESSPLKSMSAASASRGAGILPELASKSYWFPSGKVTAAGVLKTPLRVLPFGQTTKGAVKEFVTPIPKGLSSELVGQAVREKAGNLLRQATHPTFSFVENIAAAPYRFMASGFNPTLRRAGIELTQGIAAPILGPVAPFVRGEMIGEQEIGRRPTSYIEQGAEALDDLYMDNPPLEQPTMQTKRQMPGTTYYREPAAPATVDSLAALKREREAAGLTGQYAYGGTKELPHLFSYRAGVPLRKHQFVGETGDGSPFDVNGKVDKRMFDIDNPNMCGPGYKFVSGIGCVEDESYDTKPMYDMEELSKSEPRAEYAKEEIAKARYEADPITNNRPKKPNFWDKLEKISDKTGQFVDAAYAFINPIAQHLRQKDWNKKWRERGFDLSVADNTFRGNFDPNTGIFQPNQLGYKNTMYGEYGGSLNDNSMNTIRIRLIGGPVREEDEESIDSMAYGGQRGYGLDLGQRNTYTAMPKTKSEEVSSTIEEVPRDLANIEAEKGETVYADMDNDGMEEHFKIEGKRHTEGGTPLNVPEGSFVFSDTKKMAIKDPEVLEKFGLSPRKGGYTPAEIAKKYDINKYKAIAEDPTQDAMSRNTAVIMIKNYQRKLADLAVEQERMKGFPQGIPEMAMKVLPPETLEQIQAEIQELQASEESAEGAQYDLDGAPINTDSFMEDLPEMEEEYPEEEYEYGGDYDLDYYRNGGGRDWRRQRQILAKMNRLASALGGRLGVSKRYEQGDYYIPKKQAPQASGRYGNITDAEVEEWKKRHKWYFDNLKPEERARWSAGNADDVRDFQERYNQRARELGKDYGFNEDYFVPETSKAEKQRLIAEAAARGEDEPYFFDELEGKYGAYVYNTPSLDIDPTIPITPGKVMGYLCVNDKVEPKEFATEAERDAAGAKATATDPALASCKATSSQTTIPGKITEVIPKKEPPFEYWSPDIWKMNQIRSRRINKYLPFIADVPYESIEYTPEEWRAKAAELQSQTGDLARTMGAYGSTSGLGAALSALSGTQGRNLVGAIADVDARNVAGWNAFQPREQARKDQFTALRAANQTERYKGNVIANQQYDNALNKLEEDLVNARTNAFNNRMEGYLVNATNRFYNVMPRTGKLEWREGFGVDDLGQSTASANPYLQNAEQLRACLQKGYSMEECTGGKKAKYGGSSNNKRTLGEMLFDGYGFPF